MGSVSSVAIADLVVVLGAVLTAVVCSCSLVLDFVSSSFC